MATRASLKQLERGIAELEGFDVVLALTGRAVSNTKQVLTRYTYARAARGAFTVAHWRETRFANAYPGYTVTVLNGHGKPVHGKTLLSSVRASYA